MSELSELSLARVQYALPDFPGADLRAKLESGRAQAEAALRKYLPDFKFDPDEALHVMHTIDAWGERNAGPLADAMKQTAQQDLPASLHTTLGSNKQVCDFLVASFTLAAAGLGPWMGYAVHEAVERGEQSEAWARMDAQTRLQSFGMIVKLDNDGQLGPMIRGEQGTAGLGFPWAIVAVVAIFTVIFAAVVLTYLYNNRRLELNNELMRQQCMKAQAEGKDEIVAACIQATKELQQSSLIGEAGSMLTKVVLLGAGVYVLGRFVLPALLQKKGAAT